jgi:NADP-dependent 3-hydroxy acid dehydrogenase YdfG
VPTSWGVNNAGVMLLAPFTSDQRAEQRQMVEVNLLGAMTATEVFLDQLRVGGGDLYEATAIAADDVAQIIAFAVSRPRSVSLNEILVRPTAQSL